MTTRRLPFEILPTLTLVSAPYPEREHERESYVCPLPVQSISSSSSTPSQQSRPLTYLDDEQGKRVLGLIYARGGSIEKRGTTATTSSLLVPQQQHQTTFYMSSNNSEKRQEESHTPLDFIDKMNSYLHIESKGLVKHIDLQLLVDNDITIEDLVGECEIGIADLMAAGIVKDVNDLRALGFRMSDIVINRELFRAQHLADLFQLTYRKLHKMKGIEFGTFHLLKCDFYPNELLTLAFSFDHLIRDNCLSAEQLLGLNFSLSDLIALDFTKENLQMLGIGRRQALDVFKWQRKEFADFTGQPEYHRKKVVK